MQGQKLACLRLVTKGGSTAIFVNVFVVAKRHELPRTPYFARNVKCPGGINYFRASLVLSRAERGREGEVRQKAKDSHIAHTARASLSDRRSERGRGSKVVKARLTKRKYCCCQHSGGRIACFLRSNSGRCQNQPPPATRFKFRNNGRIGESAHSI